MTKQSRVTFNKYGEPSVLLNEWDTYELEQTGFVQIDDDYFAVKVDDTYYLTKTVDFENFKLNVKEEEL